MSSIGLLDCNNFFVSCERIFNPELTRKPVVVLSSNDGCVIARSQEVKDWGVPMGVPYFQWADFLTVRGAFVCSSNFALYSDISHRVMQTLNYFNPQLEIYSIDEAFLFLGDIKDPVKHCKWIKDKILQWIGIPVSIGIASTKTLAKIANRSAKKTPSFQGVYAPSQEEVDALLKTLEVEEIWGIGRRLSKFLKKKGIYTASQLRDLPDLWIKKNLSVVGLRTAWELRGTPCFELDEIHSAKQSIMTSRSFGRPVLDKGELLEAVCSYAARGAEKLREERSRASWLQLFLIASPHHAQEGYWGNQTHLVLEEPTQYTPTLLEYVSKGLHSLFRPGFSYKKAGVLLGGLVPDHHYQQDLFVQKNSQQSAKEKAAMALIDQAEKTFGRRILHFASEGIERPWQMKRGMCSPCYTTRWSDLLTIKI